MVNIITVNNKSVLTQQVTCGICDKFLVDCNTVDDCAHQFCEKCIIQKIMEEKATCCPVCNIGLDPHPLQKLRRDQLWKDMANALFALEHNNADSPSRKKERSLSSMGFSTPQAPTQPRLGGRITNFSKNKGVEQQGKATGQGGSVTNLDPAPSAAPRKRVGRPRKFPLPVQESTVKDMASTSHSVQPNTITGPTWFKLVASPNQHGHFPLPQMPDKSIRIKDSTTTVLHIQKYVMLMLNLGNENEVEISCRGEPFPPETLLTSVLSWWLQNRAPTHRVTIHVGASAAGFLMVLNYARRFQ